MKINNLVWSLILLGQSLTGCDNVFEEHHKDAMPVGLYASRGGNESYQWSDGCVLVARNNTVLDNDGKPREDKFTFSSNIWNPSKPGKYERVLEWEDNSEISLYAYIQKGGADFDNILLPYTASGTENIIIEQKSDNLDSFDYLYSYNPSLKKPADGKLSLDFKHVMSKVVINVLGRDLSKISNIQLESPMSMQFSDNSWIPSENKLKLQLPNENKSEFVAYVIPYTWENPTVILNKDGENTPLIAKYKDSIELVSGNEYSLTINLNTENIEIEFDSNINVKEWGEESIQNAIIIPKWTGEISDSFAGGNGSENNPYLISNGEELAKLAKDVNTASGSEKTIPVYSGKYFKLTSDIDLNNEEWSSIGNGINKGKFAGIFDGGNHKIYNLKICDNDGTKGYIALFGDCRPWSGAPSKIMNLTLINPYIYSNSTQQNVAALVGYAHQNLTIENCKVIGGNIEGGKNTGVILGAGQSKDIRILNCDVIDTKVSAGNVANGGIVGAINSNIIIKSCSFQGDIIGTKGANGGIVGLTNGKTGIQNIIGCYSAVNYNITGTAIFGGIVGNNSSANVTGCYSLSLNIGTESSKSTLGGLMGKYDKTEFVEGSTKYKNSIIKSFSVSELNAIGNNINDPDNHNMDDSEPQVLMKVEKLGEEEVESMNGELVKEGIEYVSSPNGIFPYIIQQNKVSE